MRFWVIIRNANAPSIILRASIIGKIRGVLRSSGSFLMRWARISLSEVDWKRLPLSSRYLRSWTELTRLPLWANAKSPELCLKRKGWTFSIPPPPVVEYLTWPIAMLPFRLERLSLLKTSVTRPWPLTLLSWPSSLTETIPQPSCPLCWRE